MSNPQGQVLKLEPPASMSAKDEWLEAFDEFWGLYPRKVGKYMARKAWLRLKPWSQEHLDEIIAGLSRWLRYWKDRETAIDFIPYPGTFINQHRHEDEP